VKFDLGLHCHFIYVDEYKRNIMSEETKDTTEETQNTTEEKKEETKETKGAVKVPSLFHNYISLAGTSITIASLASILLLFLIEMTSATEQPYLGILTYVLLPGGLMLGIFVILLGALIERWRRRKLSPEQIAAYPILDLSGPRRRRAFLVFVFLSVLFLFMTAFGSYRAYEYTESVEFCGQRCHTVMKPEFMSFQAAPHARLHCVDCHVGGGAEWYVRSKFAGVRQLYAVTFNTYDKPIKTPVHNMRPANDTCQKCHWSEKFHGEVMRVFNHYGYDEKNSLKQTRMLVKVGGGTARTGATGGIHWHMNLANEITYMASDEKRQVIPWVRMKDMNGNVVEYMSKDAKLTPQEIENAPKKKMDCIDCHSRPTHIFLSPNNAVDQSLEAGRLDLSLPYLKAKAVEALSGQYGTTDEAVNAIAFNFEEYYRTNHADVYSAKKDSIKAAVAELQQLYQTYFFPEMKTNWATHANNIGHFNSQGCFRCHDGQHFSPEGKVIRNECNICHTTVDQTFQGKTIASKDGIFQHPVNLGDRGNWLCSTCHKGDRSFKHPLNLGDISRFECVECHKGDTLKMNF
jgi:nitrate/TMAO reductase-like tetraheme cytochrome c subunit